MVSVCMATYNGQQFICKQIDSILKQLSKEDELIISDDGSKDRTVDLILEYKDARIKIYHNANNHGVNGNFENALRYARGDYIFLADQDDIWLEGKVNTCIKALQNVDCVVHDAIIVDQNLKLINKSLFKNIKGQSGFFHNLIKNGYTGCCMAFTKKVAALSLPFPTTNLFYHDQWIGLISELKFKTLFIPDKLIYFRRHNSTTSTAGGRSRLSIRQKLKNRIQLIINLLKR